MAVIIACEPCNAYKIWNKINLELCKIIDLSVSEEETNRKKLEIETKYKTLLTA